jgi:hypothetical protein
MRSEAARAPRTALRAVSPRPPCDFAIARLDPHAAPAGSIAQIFGTLPAEGKGKSRVVPHFLVDASLAKLSRDPEPILSVRVRPEPHK